MGHSFSQHLPSHYTQHIYEQELDTANRLILSVLEVVFPQVCSYETVKVVEISALATSGTPTSDVAPISNDARAVCS